MKLRLTLLVFVLAWLRVSTVWSYDSRDAAYPSYEPPHLEDLPTSVEEAAPTAPPEAPPPSPALEPSAPEASPSSAAPAPAFQEYRVWIWQENGDSLSQIAEKVYGDPQKWRLIYLANKDLIKDPNRIYPKQKLRIPPADWNPDNGQ